MEDEQNSLTHEISLLRATIQQLRQLVGEGLGDGHASREDLKLAAELRKQIDALCTALRTRQQLEGGSNAQQQLLLHVLDELGEELISQESARDSAD